MLSRIQIEARVLAVYDAVKSGRRVEDALVELKGQWPDPQKAARRLAGHANAARGEAIIWIVGLDEEDGVVDSGNRDAAEWWPQVQSHFDGLSPTLDDLVVHTDDGPIAVLRFDTSLGPFVVKNPAYGTAGSGPVEREVPWREGTGVRSARREDLIRMLAPLQALPAIELLGASIRLTEEEPRTDRGGVPVSALELEPHLRWSIEIEMYVSPQIGSVSVLPVHTTAVSFELSGGARMDVDNSFESLPFYRAHYSVPYTSAGVSSAPDSASIETTSSEAIVHLPGRLHYRTTHLEPMRAVSPAATATLVYRVVPVYTEHAVQLEIPLRSSDPQYKEKMWWATSPI